MPALESLEFRIYEPEDGLAGGRSRLDLSLPAHRRLVRILVVDDDPDVLDVTSTLLEGEGYSVARACNGREALEALPQIRPHLVLLDLMMPVMDGQTFCARMRQGEHRETPILVMSADHAGARKAREMRVEAFLGKPFDVYELLDHVRRLAEERLALTTASMQRK